CGSSSSNPVTARNSFTRNWHAPHAARCFSISSRSLSFKRPSTYAKILFSIRLQLITAFLLYPRVYCCFLAWPREGLVLLATFRMRERAGISARSPSIRESLQYLHNPILDTYAKA